MADELVIETVVRIEEHPGARAPSLLLTIDLGTYGTHEVVLPTRAFEQKDLEGASDTTIYFGSDDIEADLAKVRELGGKADDKQPIPGIGWFARCKDSEGNRFSLFQGDESVTMPEGAPGA